MNLSSSISLCMIVKNEEKNLRRCLESVKNCVDQIIIVDTGSTDHTINIAKKFNSEIFHFDWIDDFSAARNYSLKQAKNDWILILDADEELTAESAKSLKEHIYLAELQNFSTISIQLRDMDKHRTIHNSFMQFKLWKNSPDVKYKGNVHEKASVQLPVFNSGLTANHFGYISISENLKKEKFLRNYRLLCKGHATNPEDYFILKALIEETIQNNRLEESLDLFKKLEILNNIANNESLLFLKSLMHFKLNNFAESAKIAENAIILFPEHFELYFIAAFANKKLQNNLIVISQLEDYLKLTQQYKAGLILQSHNDIHFQNKNEQVYSVLINTCFTENKSKYALDFIIDAYKNKYYSLAVNLLRQNLHFIKIEETSKIINSMIEIKVIPEIQSFVKEFTATLKAIS